MTSLPKNVRLSKRDVADLNAQFRCLVENVTDYAIFLIDASGHISTWNLGAERIKGYRSDEIVGSHFSILYTPEDRAAGRPENLLRRAREEGIAHDEGWRLRKDGSRFWADVVLTALRNARGGIQGFAKVTRDITERAAAEEEIRRLNAELEQRFEATFEQAEVGISHVDVDGRFLRVNRKFCELFGYSSDDLLALGFAGLTHSEDVDESMALLASLKRSPGEGRVLEKRYLRKDGTEFWAQVTTRLAHADEDGGDYFVTVTEDISARKYAEFGLREAEQRYRTLFDQAPSAVWVVVDERIALANHATAEFFGASSPDELIGQPIWRFIDPAYHEPARERLARILKRGESTQPREYVMRRLDGTPVEAQMHSAPLDFTGRKGAQVIAQDVTERNRQRRDLEFKNALLSTQQDTALDGILVVDENGSIVSYNRQFRSIWGITEEVMASRSDARAIASVLDRLVDPEGFEARLKELYANRSERSSEEIALKDGRVLDRYSAPMRGADGTYYGRVWYFRDITDRKRNETRIEYLATHDGLTGVANRNLLNDRFAQAIAHARRADRPLALFVLDVDHFKRINDSYGHPVGDELLRQLARRLAHGVRAGDTVARLGGDEFAVLTSDIRRPEDASEVLRKLRDAFGQPFAASGRALHATASIGVSLFPDDGEDAETLFRNADIAMYRAKELGRDSFQFFTREMSERARRRAEIEAELRHALERGELDLHYQPQIEMASGRLVGAEALLRWRHPQWGPVSPAEFVPVAERAGLVGTLGAWVLERACRQAADWSRRGLWSVPVAVNVSALQFSQDDFASGVARALERAGLTPELLELEITETSAMEHAHSVIARLEALNAIGVRLTIDDFGTGYSSLSYLRRFPIDCIKLDQSFVRDLPDDSDAAAVARAVVGLGQSLALRVVAEGVETSPQAAFLRDIGCSIGQGYLYTRPLPAGEFEAWYRGASRPGNA